MSISDFMGAKLFRMRGEITEGAIVPWLELTDQAQGTLPDGDRKGVLEVPRDAWIGVANYTGIAGDPWPQNQMVLVLDGGPAMKIERVGPPDPWHDGSTTGTFWYQITGRMERDEFEALVRPGPAGQAPPQ